MGRRYHPIAVALVRCALTHNQAAKALRVTPSALSHILARRRRPSLPLALRMCDAFAIPLTQQRAFLDAVVAVAGVDGTSGRKATRHEYDNS